MFGRALPSLFGSALLSLALACERQHAAPEPNVAGRHASEPLMAAPPVAAPTAPEKPADPGSAFDPPARLRLPNGLAAGERVPLLVLLHGFGVSSTLLILKAGLNGVADQKKFAYLAPEGRRDAQGRPFWNAGKSCCDLENTGVDDVTRLRELLDASLKNPAIDPQRVFVIGYSNGGFMAQRLACEVGDRIAGVISVAGAAPSKDVACTQSTRLSFLEIHGDADPVVHYAGGTVFDRTDVALHASAPDTAKYWAQHIGCSGELHDVENVDIEPYVAGSETQVQRYDDCRGTVELWTVKGGAHYVALQPPAIEAMWRFVQAHPKS